VREGQKDVQKSQSTKRPHAVVGIGSMGSVAVSRRPLKRSISFARTNCRRIVSIGEKQSKKGRKRTFDFLKIFQKRYGAMKSTIPM
jgi:hypothetical protein